MSNKDAIHFPKLWQYVTSQFLLGKNSIHGPAHWRRVEEFGLRVAEISGADVTVVRLFAVLHDARRESDSWDPLHGTRGAQLAQILRGHQFQLDDARLATLVEACTYHADGFTSRNVTIGTCWDADRLDLPRCGVIPRVDMMSTAAAKDRKLIAWAMERKG